MLPFICWPFSPVIADFIEGICELYYIVNGIIDKKTIQEKMFDANIKKALTTLVDTCENIVSLKDLLSDRTMILEGYGISSEIEEGQKIYAA